MTSSLMGFSLDPNKDFAYCLGQPLRGINIVFKDDSVLFVVKSTDKTGKPIVAFIEAHSVEDCWTLLHRWIHFTDFSLKWYPDKFAS